MFDYHIHTTHSGDGQVPDRAQIWAAIYMGLDEICITDHMEVHFPLAKHLNFELDVPSYVSELQDLAQEFRTEINVKWGLEVGLQNHSLAETEQRLEGYPFHYILAARHMFDYEPPYRPDWNALTKAEVFDTYLRHILECVKIYRRFNCLAHLTYYCRMCPAEDPSLHYSHAPDAIDELFTLLVERGQGIEINTSTYKRFGYCMPDLDIVRRFRELGGEVITVGSDAHMPNHVGNHLKEGLQLIQAAGLDYVCTFEYEKPIFHKISSLI